MFIDNLFKKWLEKYVVKYLNRHPDTKLVIVAGGVGKTSTKKAIATLLSKKYRVTMCEDDSNTKIRLMTPLAILGVNYYGEIKGIKEWIKVLTQARRQAKSMETDIIVAEVDAHYFGAIEKLKKYLKPNVCIVSGITPEHMGNFNSIEEIADEYFSLVNISDMAIINRDDVEGRFASFLTNPNIDTYGTSGLSEYRFETKDFTLEKGYDGLIITPDFEQSIPVSIKVVGENNIRPIIGAVAVSVKLGLSFSEIIEGINIIRPIPGRMNVLKGIEGSTILDDTYSSGPLSATAALQTLYSIQAPQRIAILGDMNDLGILSEAEHKKLGDFCDSRLLAWVVTIGDNTEKYLAPQARAKGCQVKCFKSAIEAGSFAHRVIENGSLVLVKGSADGIYAEEAVKVLCYMTADNELVRQSDKWMKEKEEFFSKYKV